MIDWEGQTVLDRDGEKIGKVEEILIVEETGRADWALVKLGRLKSHTTLVPLTRAQSVKDGVVVHVKKDVVSKAPEIKPDADPSEQQVNALYRHYGIEIFEERSGDAGTRGNGASAQPPAAGQVSGSPDLRDEPIGELFKTVKEEGSTLVGQSVKLAKAEMSGKAKDMGIGAGMFGGAGYVTYLASIAFMLTVIFALAEVMPAWTAALIVTVLLGAAAAVLALKAKQRIKQAGPPIPEQTVESVKQTLQTVKEEAKWGLGQTR
ncbi:MAG: phage holin family protein [Actinobacteria bacterium]|nr:phage holin family protein [Actinomycetota bacterium]